MLRLLILALAVLIAAAGAVNAATPQDVTTTAYLIANSQSFAAQGTPATIQPAVPLLAQADPAAANQAVTDKEIAMALMNLKPKKQEACDGPTCSKNGTCDSGACKAGSTCSACVKPAAQSSGFGARVGWQRGQPLRNAGRVALAPLRWLRGRLGCRSCG